MKTDTYFRISVIDAGLAIIRHQEKYPSVYIQDTIRQLREGLSHQSSLDYEAAIDLADIVGWECFQPSNDRRTELNITLKNLATRGRPFWARMSIFGRDKVIRVLSDDQLQCLMYAGLLEEPPTPNIIAWWDQVASSFRVLAEERKIEIGRRGEALTIRYERERLANLGILDREPVWVSINDNSAGYDVLSYDLDYQGHVQEISIEVKASVSVPLRFIVTRNEWNFALRNSSLHRFHIWNLVGELLHTLSVGDIAPHVPIDEGSGYWLQAEFRLDQIIS